MKKSSMKLFALILALVMVIGVMPIVSADEPVVISGSISGNDTAWPGTTVGLTLELDELPDGYGKQIRWDAGSGSGSNSVAYPIPANATGTVVASVTVDVLKSAAVVTSKTFTHPITILTPAGSDFAITGGATEVTVGESTTFGTTGENDSKVTWSVSPTTASISGGRFRATAEGVYTVTATATNGSSAEDDVTDTVTVNVTGADYTVNMPGKVYSLTQANPAMTVTILDKNGEEVTSGYTMKFSSSDPSVASVDDEGNLTLNKGGETEITVVVTIDGQEYSDTATVTVNDSGAITCAQNYKENSGDSCTMRFVLNGVDADDVKWSISVSGSEEFSVEDEETSGIEASATIVAEDGIGVATVKASATWNGGSGSASGTFYISFYNSKSYTVVLKEGVDEFDFDETGVFESVSGTSNAARTTMHSLLTDGCGTNVILSETSSRNSRIGKITYGSSGSFSQYDPDEENDYSTNNLDKLSFEVLGAGEYKLNYENYESMGYSGGLATSRGTITIVTGDAGHDIVYTAVPGGSVNFEADDFDKFWDKSDKDDDDEKLNYITFDVATSSDTNGTLYADGKQVKSTTKFGTDDSKSKSTIDIDDLTYSAPSTKKDFVDYFTFICHGEDDTEISGVVAVEVGGGTMKFTDVSKNDWFYDEVYTVWTKGVMTGTTETTFAPNTKLSRSMLVTMLFRMDGSPRTGVNNAFSDVPSGQWYTDAVEWAAANNIVNGVGNGKFAPNMDISREQLATILYRYTKNYLGENASKSGSLSSFSDQNKVSSFALEAMKWAVGEGIITGSNGKLNPLGSATRAEAAAMFARFMDLDLDAGSSNSSKNDYDLDDDDTVYITTSGSKFHLDRSCAGSGAKKRTYEEVEDDYKPCTKCVDVDDDDDDDDDEIVYITLTGTKYHLDEDCAGTNARERTLASVEDRYEPCSKCAK